MLSETRETMNKISDKMVDSLTKATNRTTNKIKAQKEQKKDLINLLKKIKEVYPKKEFLQNAGLDLVPETLPYINAIVVELYLY